MYKEQEKRGSVSEKAQFEYAWCLVRSRYQNDMKRGIALLEGEVSVAWLAVSVKVLEAKYFH